MAGLFSKWKKKPDAPVCSAVIVAAGSARRMEGIDKVLAPLGEMPVLVHTLYAFQDCPQVGEIVVVTREDLLVEVSRLCQDYSLNKVRKVIVGGAERIHSVQAGLRETDPEAELIARIKTLGCPSVLVINKVDTLEHKEELLEVIQTYGQAHEFTAVVPVSARTGEGVEELLDVLDGFLPQGPQLFPEDMVTDQPERQMMAEILREKLLLCLDKEIPHGTAVEITKFSERDDEVIEIDATIYCEKNSHKGIIIGKGGAMLKKVSSLARQDMERFMGTKVYLQTWVKVKENWRDNVNLIRNFGYRDE